MANYGFTVPAGGYDDQNRLTAWNRNDNARNQNWGLSAVGDWNTFTDAGVAETRTHGPTHEILTIGAATVVHDSRGNMTQDEQGEVMTWDVNGMLASVTVPAEASTGVAGTHSYQYDVLGRRVRKITTGSNASDTVYIHEGSRVMCEYTYGEVYSNPLRTYVYASYVDELVLIIDRTAAGAVGAGVDERFFYHRNQQYSVTALSDAAGTVTERYAYTAYGEPKILDGAGTTTRTASFIGNPYLYTGRAYDAESGLYYFRARMYEGRKGRFLSHDPNGYPDGANTYAGWFVPTDMDPWGGRATTRFGYPLILTGRVHIKEQCLAAKLAILASLPPEGDALFNHYFEGTGTPMTIPGDFIRQIARNDPRFTGLLSQAEGLCSRGRELENSTFMSRLVYRYIDPYKYSLGDFYVVPSFTCNGCSVCWILTLFDTFNFDKRPPGTRTGLAEAATTFARVHESLCGWKSFEVNGTISGGCD